MIGHPKPKKKAKKSNTIPEKLVVEVFQRDNHCCQYRISAQCVQVHNEYNNSLHCHHIVKRRKADGHKKELLNACCWACHHEHGEISKIDKRWLDGENVYYGGRLKWTEK